MLSPLHFVFISCDVAAPLLYFSQFALGSSPHFFLITSWLTSSTSILCWSTIISFLATKENVFDTWVCWCDSRGQLGNLTKLRWGWQWGVDDVKYIKKVKRLFFNATVWPHILYHILLLSSYPTAPTGLTPKSFTILFPLTDTPAFFSQVLSLLWMLWRQAWKKSVNLKYHWGGDAWIELQHGGVSP